MAKSKTIREAQAFLTKLAKAAVSPFADKPSNDRAAEANRKADHGQRLTTELRTRKSNI